MPDMLAGLHGAERDDVVEDLVHYLASLGGPLPLEPFQATDGMLEEGRQLLHEVGCVACHVPEEALEELYEPLAQGEHSPQSEADEVLQDIRYVPEGTLPAPEVPFNDLARQTTVSALAEFLMDPVAIRPSGRMPSMQLSNTEARDIAVYLLRGQGQVQGYTKDPGLHYAYYEQSFRNGVPDLSERVPERVGVLLSEFEDLEDAESLVEMKHREDNFAFEFRGTLIVEAGGTYVFHTESDDGSWIFIDGKELVNNGGLHGVRHAEGSVELGTGAHSFRLTYYEQGGGNELIVNWSGPGFELRPLRGDDFVHRTLPMAPVGAEPFTLDPARVTRGRTRFLEVGCANCHESLPQSATPLEDCNVLSSDGCLATHRSPGTASYNWTDGQRDLVQALLLRLGELSSPSPEEHASTLMARQRCYACHRRDGVGGPQPERSDYFFAAEEIDLGEEGRLPPLLDSVGSKLQPEWLTQVLQEGATVRPHLLTRMPQFGAESMPAMHSALVAADQLDSPPRPRMASSESLQAGRELAGTGGLGCIQCHDFNGYPSLGIRAVDLGTVAKRIQYPWFRELLRDPAALNMNSRMPQFVVNGKSPVQDVLEGDVDAQIDALWSYLRMGDSMMLPEGLDMPDSAYELEMMPGDAPKIVGVFMRGLSPRVVAVGTPEQVHYAFDVQNSRLAKAWRGRFFNARGTWEGRAGQLELPPGSEVFDLPEGPPFEFTDEDPDALAGAPTLRARGRGYDEQRRPIFRYSLGEIQIEETPVPLNEGEHGVLIRRFRLESPVPITNLIFNAADGHQAVVFELASEGLYIAEFEERFTW